MRILWEINNIINFDIRSPFFLIVILLLLITIFLFCKQKQSFFPCFKQRIIDAAHFIGRCIFWTFHPLNRRVHLKKRTHWDSECYIWHLTITIYGTILEICICLLSGGILVYRFGVNYRYFYYIRYCQQRGEAAESKSEYGAASQV